MARKPKPTNWRHVQQDERTIEKIRHDEPVRGKAAKVLKAWRDDVHEGEDER